MTARTLTAAAVALVAALADGPAVAAPVDDPSERILVERLKHRHRVDLALETGPRGGVLAWRRKGLVRAVTLDRDGKPRGTVNTLETRARHRDPVVAVDERGNAIVAWLGYDRQKTESPRCCARVEAALLTPAGRVRAHDRFSHAGENVDAPPWVAMRGGRAVLSYTGPGGLRLTATTTARTWLPPVLVQREGGYGVVGIRPDGVVRLLWNQHVGAGEWAPRESTWRPGGPVSAPVPAAVAPDANMLDLATDGTLASGRWTWEGDPMTLQVTAPDGTVAGPWIGSPDRDEETDIVAGAGHAAVTTTERLSSYRYEVFVGWVGPEGMGPWVPVFSGRIIWVSDFLAGSGAAAILVARGPFSRAVGPGTGMQAIVFGPEGIRTSTHLHGPSLGGTGAFIADDLLVAWISPRGIELRRLPGRRPAPAG